MEQVSRACAWTLIGASWFPFLGLGWLQGWAYALLLVVWHRSHGLAYRTNLLPDAEPRTADRRQATLMAYLTWPWYVLGVTLSGSADGGIWVMLAWQAGLLGCVLTWGRVNEISDRTSKALRLIDSRDDDRRWGRPRP